MRVRGEAPLGEDLTEQVGAVRDDPVDAQVEQPPHLGGVVDRPHVDLPSRPVRGGEGPRVDDVHRTLSHRDLEAVDVAQGAGHPGRRPHAGPQQEPDHLALPGRRRDGTAQAGDGRASSGDRERRDADAVVRVRPLDGLGDGSHPGLTLDVDVDPQVGPGAEQVVEPRHGFGPADPGPPDDVPGQLRDDAARVGGPVERRVVQRDGDAVGRSVGVRLDVPEAELAGCFERAQRVLEPVEREPAVGERDERCVEIRRRAHRSASSRASSQARTPSR
ncbi:hypothetical protein GCM10025864_36640 [Luteimicrobium album]|uniref:Uncharacterized protein n=1 Tax=Luteimicrobium album TaxID=1054550 RepID=A0ABQ6I832_9MICO|nr:hypothetical protein GCM10025864_36640 [Luteimicrobium album]